MTLAPFASRRMRPLARPSTEPWQTDLNDAERGRVRLTGRLLRGSKTRCVVAVHGLGGNSDSGYMALVLRAAHEAGDSCLLLNCRGADRSGADVYHSGLYADLEAALASPELRAMQRIDLFGYSVGGHIALRYCCSDKLDARVGRVAAIGSPLHLRAAADDFDAASFNIYRHHVMDALKEIYTVAYQQNPRGISPLEARKISKIREWDEKIIAPRFGFKNADDYYESESVGPRLAKLKIEGIYVGGSFDPMILASSVKPYLGGKSLKIVWDDSAGHLGFQSGFSLDESAPLGLESQVLSWLSR